VSKSVAESNSYFADQVKSWAVMVKSAGLAK
jgi:hypothetical protein